MDILNQFGVQPVLLAAQVVNFFILLFILKKLLYGPILKVLEKRKQTIAQSLKNADEIETRLKEISEKEAAVLLKSAREGEKIIKEASDHATEIIENGKREYENTVKKASEDAKKMAQLEKENMMREVKENLGELLVLALQKVTGKVITKEEQKKIIEREVKNVS